MFSIEMDLALSNIQIGRSCCVTYLSIVEKHIAVEINT